MKTSGGGALDLSRKIFFSETQRENLMKTKPICMIVAVGLLAANALSYGPPGHSMVGAIADRRLAKSNATISTKVHDIIDHLTLADAALLPDEIKDWDRGGPTPLPRLTRHPTIQTELEAYWTANHADEDGQARHRVYHFTDVPVLGHGKYADGPNGRTDHDIVKMITFCVKVLNGEERADNPRKITKAVAVILLAHFLGDIHQPLHVGAEYFNAAKRPTNPDAGGEFFIDEGGNNLNLSLRTAGPGRPPVPTNKVLHGYWDGTAAATAMGLMRTKFMRAHPGHSSPSVEDLAEEFATIEPADWKLPASVQVKDWAEAFANEILPLAAEAHERLQFRRINIVTKHGRREAAGTAEERATQGGDSYKQFAGKVVLNEIHKGGWRLAALLEQIVH